MLMVFNLNTALTQEGLSVEEQSDNFPAALDACVVNQVNKFEHFWEAFFIRRCTE